MDNIQLPHIKRDALISLSFGAQFISRIQGSLMYLTSTMSEQDMITLKVKVERNEPLTEQEAVIVTLSTLMVAITKEAEKTGQVVQQDIQSTFGI